jgi:hypothetical protein
MDDWIAVEPKDQERIWQVATALLSQGPQAGGPATLEEALQRACAEFYAARRALTKGVRFYVVEGGEQHLRKVRVLENGTWVNERAKPRPRPTE